MNFGTIKLTEPTNFMEFINCICMREINCIVIRKPIQMRRMWDGI
jgi:hypothetical protein